VKLGLRTAVALGVVILITGICILLIFFMAKAFFGTYPSGKYATYLCLVAAFCAIFIESSIVRKIIGKKKTPQA